MPGIFRQADQGDSGRDRVDCIQVLLQGAGFGGFFEDTFQAFRLAFINVKKMLQIVGFEKVVAGAYETVCAETVRVLIVVSDAENFTID